MVNLLFFLNLMKGRSSHQNFITQGMGQSSMFLTFRTVYNYNFNGGEFGLRRNPRDPPLSFEMQLVVEILEWG